MEVGGLPLSLPLTVAGNAFRAARVAHASAQGTLADRPTASCTAVAAVILPNRPVGGATCSATSIGGVTADATVILGAAAKLSVDIAALASQFAIALAFATFRSGRHASGAAGTSVRRAAGAGGGVIL